MRAYLVPHAQGVVLVDTGMDAAGDALDAALSDVGASWSDVTPGHVSFLDEDRGVLLVGDCLGTLAGRLGHGPELADPWDQLDALLQP